MERGSSDRQWAFVAIMVMVGLPAIVMRLSGYQPNPEIDALGFGLAILAAAFLLSWAAETAELDIPQGMAIAAIAFIAVLPEYAVDAVLSWRAGADPAEAAKGLAIANMTGGNRLLIGIGWTTVFALFYYRTHLKQLVVDKHRALELTFLFIASVYIGLVGLRHTLTLIDTIVLVSMFFCYLFFTSKIESEDVELVGPAKVMGELTTKRRRALVLALLVYSAAVIFCAAEPFADSLVHTGERLGVSEFLLIQWLAPIASEAPEVLVAGMLAWRGRAAVGMGALISSEVNQMTLLVGTLPLVFALAGGGFHLTGGLPLDDRQREEILLTAAQSAFAVAVFANLKMGTREAVTLFTLFGASLLIPSREARLLYAAAYCVACVVVLFLGRAALPTTLKAAWHTLIGYPDPSDAAAADTPPPVSSQSR